MSDSTEIMPNQRLDIIRRGDLPSRNELPYGSRDQAVDALIQELFRQDLGASDIVVRRMYTDIRDLADALAQERGI